MTGYEWLAEHRESVLFMCKRWAKCVPLKQRAHLVDVLWSECVDRCERIRELWDGERPLNNFMRKNLKWYIFKKSRKEAKRAKGDKQLPRDPRGQCDEQLCDLPEVILSRLSPEHRQLLVWKHVDEMRFEDIADALGKAKGTAVLYYQRALEAAREVARELGEDVP